MSEIKVSAEHGYSVELSESWTRSLTESVKDRARVAIIVSESLTSRVQGLDLESAEVFTFVIPDGEAGKSSGTLLKIWDWLGAAGFTRSDLIVGIGGERSLTLQGLLQRVGSADLIGLRYQQQLLAQLMQQSVVRLQ